jgi:hypothetical protein
MFSLRITTAVWPTLSRLGALVLQDVLCDCVGVASAGAGVGVASVAGIDVSVVASVVGSDVGVSVEGTVVGVAVSSIVTGTEVGVRVSAMGCITGVSIGAGELPFVVAHPRRSMRSRMIARTPVTIVLNRS